MNFVGSLLGYGDDAEIYATNVVAQWRILNDTYTTPPTDQWLAFHRTFVANYGPPAATETEMRQRALNAYENGIDNALVDGFVDGIKSIPATVANYIKGVAGDIDDKIPLWVKLAAAGVAALVGIQILTNAGILGKRAK